MIKTILKDWKDLQIQEVEMPKIGKEEALIRLIYGGICGTDVHVYNHNHKTAKVPVVLGHEYCGELVDFQTEFPTDLKVGDLVTSHPLNACKVCEPCLSGHENVCEHLEIYGVHTDGCFCEYIKVPIHKVYKFHKDIPTKVAALVEPLAVAVHDVRESGLRMSDSVFIIGGGPIGLFIALVASQCGASKVDVYKRQGLLYSDGSPIIGTPPDLQWIGQGKIFGEVPVQALLFIIVAVAAWAILKYTPLGRYTYAIGGNQEASRLSGINVKKITTSIYSISGLLAGFAGVLMATQLNIGEAKVGDQMEMDAIAAVVIGGTSLKGGVGSVIGTIIGVLIMGFLSNLLNLISVPSYYQMIFKGVIIVGATILQSLQERKKA